jgi:2-polyprenyl-3-methyl-5-hydroxy-6-metoxy-1,4-benzoquinol methylase
MNSELIKSYTEKSEDYFNCLRPEMLPYIPAQCSTILDVGCGRGLFGASLKNIKTRVVWGVEPDFDCIEEATKNLDKIYHGCFQPEIALPEDYFDCIVFNDVLEHILEPVPILEYAKKLLKRGGSIVASIPNIMHFPILWKLLINGEWNYTERGILDRTHLRFYTRKSIQNLISQSGLLLEQIDGINSYHSMEASDEKLWNYYRVLQRIPSDSIHDMRYLQFAIVAKR